MKLSCLPPTIFTAAIVSYSLAQPIIHEGYRQEIFTQPKKENGNKYCYNYVFPSSTSGSNDLRTSQYLAMFSDKFVEIDGRVYTVKNADNSGGFPHYPHHNLFPWDEQPNGLYEVVDDPSLTGRACVYFSCKLKADNIGQIVASSMFDPIKIIGVDQATNEIYGYYYASGSGGFWQRKTTIWGDAEDGSLVAEPVENGDISLIGGISTTGSYFNLWGNFDYSRQDDIQCASRPAIIDDWTGFWAGSRGAYCPGVDDNQLWKYTWHGSGSITEKLGWTPAAKVARLGPKSNIFGISTEGKLLLLWDEKNVAVHSVDLDHLGPIKGVKAVGGFDDVFVSNEEDKVYNVYWDSEWKAKIIDIDYGFLKMHELHPNANNPLVPPPHTSGEGQAAIFFGSRGGKNYLLYCMYWEMDTCHSDNGCSYGYFYVYRLDFIGGENRYKAEVVHYWAPGVIFDGLP